MENKNHQLFDAYIMNLLSTEEKVAFEDRLASDEVLLKDFKAYEDVHSFLKSGVQNKPAVDNFRKTLQHTDTEYFENKEKEKKESRIINFKPWYYAVAASVILVFGFIFTQSNSTPDYIDYANYGTMNISVRSQAQELTVKAEEAFNTGDYDNAVVLLSDLLEDDPTRVELQLYKAIALVETNQFTEADVIFENLYKGKSVFKNKALWYAVLSKLKQQDFEACKLLIKSIPNSTEDYDAAQRLLNEL